MNFNLLELLPKSYTILEVEELKKTLENSLYNLVDNKRINSFYFLVERFNYRLINHKYISDNDFDFLSKTIQSFSDILTTYDLNYNHVTKEIMNNERFDKLLYKLDTGLFFEDFLNFFSYDFFLEFIHPNTFKLTDDYILEDLRKKEKHIPIEIFLKTFLTTNDISSLNKHYKNISSEIEGFLYLFDSIPFNRKVLLDFYNKVLLQIELLNNSFRLSPGVSDFLKKKDFKFTTHLKTYSQNSIGLLSKETDLYRKISDFNSMFSDKNTKIKKTNKTNKTKPTKNANFNSIKI